jgi:molecular chaperone IbpA
MRTTLDFSPLFRSSVGFDRLLNAVEANRAEEVDNWPPYDIIKAGEDDYRIIMAVAGFWQTDLTVTQEQNLLIVSGHRAMAIGAITCISALPRGRSSGVSNSPTI